MRTQLNFIFTITTLYNYIKNYLLQEIDYFEDKIESMIIPISISDNLFHYIL